MNKTATAAAAATVAAAGILALGYVDIALSRPVEMGAVQVSSLRMREPTVNDNLAMDAMSGTDAQKEIGVFANLCEVAPADIQKLTLRDYRKLQKAFAAFID